MSISRHNYESYIMDYLDGNLDPVGVSEVLLFLEQNPDIRDEFEGLTTIHADADEVSDVFDKRDLHRPAYADVKVAYEEVLIAKLEKDLTLAQFADLEKAFKIYPELRRDDELFRATVSVPDRGITFPAKSKLKKNTLSISGSILLRIAAVMLLLGFVSMMWLRFSQAPQSLSSAEPGKENQGNKHSVSVIPQAAVKNNDHGPSVIPDPGKLKRKPEETADMPRAQAHETQAVQLEQKAGSVPLPQLAAPGKESLIAVEAQIQYPSDRQEAQPVFEDLATIAMKKINKSREQLLGKGSDGAPLTLTEAITKKAREEVTIERNSEGKLKRFEIAALGIEWTHSR